MGKKKLTLEAFGEREKVTTPPEKVQPKRQALRQAHFTKSVDNAIDKRQALRQAEIQALIKNDNKKVKQTIRIDRQKYIKIKAYCNNKSISFQSVIDDLINVFCKEL